MHAGWPFLDSILALLYAHPNVYLDVGALQRLWCLGQHTTGICAAWSKPGLESAFSSAPTSPIRSGLESTRSLPRISSLPSKRLTSCAITLRGYCALTVLFAKR